MNKYKFKIRNPEGKILREVIYGESIDDVKKLLEKSNNKVLRLKLLKKDKTFLTPRVNYEQLATFTKKLSLMLQSGVALIDALTNIEESMKQTYWRIAIHQICKDLQIGINFSKTLENYPSLFPKLFIMMVKVSEVVGNLGDVMDYLSSYYLKEYRLKQKLRNSLMYPIILIVVTVIIFLALIFVVIPKFEDIFKNLNVDSIPTLTKIIFGVSSFIRHYYLLLLLGIVSVIFVFYLLLKSNSMFKDRMKLKLPVIKTYNKWLIISRFTRSLSMMYTKGISLTDAFIESSIIINNKYLLEKLNNVSENVHRGVSLSKALIKIKFFPSLFIELITVGEKSNKVGDILVTLSDYYEKEAENRLNKISQTIEPIIIIFISLVVMLVVLSIFVPMFGMMDQIMEV